MAQKLPIGIQTFEHIREEGYLYVDKTMYCKQLLSQGKYLFLSRPRRFGKSLLLSTLRAIFEGKKHLFKGLYLENEIDWQPVPVVFLDFNALDYQQFPLAEELEKAIEYQAHLHGITLTTPRGAKAKFSELLQQLGRAAVLIDEYDKPVTDYLGHERQGEYLDFLKSFYGTLKSQSAYISFCLVTGVSKLGKMSIFSDLNHLQDITLHPDYADMLGVTQAELEYYFPDDLRRIAAQMAITAPELLARLKRMYNGYAWRNGNTLYCPFSLLSFFSSGQMLNYWFETGTPTFLTKLLKDKSVLPTELEALVVGQATIQSGDVQYADPISLLFQTGYLTIKGIESDHNGLLSFTLGYPNQEVRHAFSLHLMATYSDQSVGEVEKNVAHTLKKALINSNWEGVKQIINSQLANVSHLLHRADEAWYHAMAHLAFAVTGLQLVSEYSTAQGRIDDVLFDGETVFIIEYKLDGSADAALEQIEDKEYTLPFGQKSRVVRIGINFDSQTRQIAEIKAVEHRHG